MPDVAGQTRQQARPPRKPPAVGQRAARSPSPRTAPRPPPGWCCTGGSDIALAPACHRGGDLLHAGRCPPAVAEFEHHREHAVEDREHAGRDRDPQPQVASIERSPPKKAAHYSMAPKAQRCAGGCARAAANPHQILNSLGQLPAHRHALDAPRSPAVRAVRRIGLNRRQRLEVAAAGPVMPKPSARMYPAGSFFSCWRLARAAPARSPICKAWRPCARSSASPRSRPSRPVPRAGRPHTPAPRRPGMRCGARSAAG